MLSFLKDQEIPDSQASASAGDRADNAGGAEQANNKEYLTVATRSKNVRKTTCLLAVVFGIGLLCLVFMIKKSSPEAASGTTITDAKIEKTIQKLTGIKSEVFGRMDQIVNKFYEFSDVKQVNVSELTKDPFKRDLLPDVVELPVDNSEDEALRLQRIMLLARDLQLLSIMSSEQGRSCMINDKILYEGESIKGFRVCQISDVLVKLRYETGSSEDPSAGTEADNGPLGTEIVLELSK
jgi:preprotein translocase subunit SecG